MGCCSATREAPIFLCNSQFITALTTSLHRKQPHLKNPFPQSCPTFQDMFCGVFCVKQELRPGKEWSMKQKTQCNKTDCTVNIVVAIHRMIAHTMNIFRLLSVTKDRHCFSVLALLNIAVTRHVMGGWLVQYILQIGRPHSRFTSNENIWLWLFSFAFSSY